MPRRHNVLDAGGRVKLEWLNPRKLKPDLLIYLFADRRMGKSFAIRDLLYHMRSKWRHALVFAKADVAADNSLQDHIPPINIFTEFDEEFVAHLMREMGNTIAYGAEHGNIFGKDVESMRNWLVVLEDMVSGDSKKSMRGAVMEDLAKLGRHKGACVIEVIHTLKDLPKGIIRAPDLVFFLKNTSRTAIDDLYKEYGTAVTPSDWRTLFDHATRDYGMLVLDKTEVDPDPIKQLKYYKACSVPVMDPVTGKQALDNRGAPKFDSPHKNWRIGSKAMWKYSAQHCREVKHMAPKWIMQVREGQKTEANLLRRTAQKMQQLGGSSGRTGGADDGSLSRMSGISTALGILAAMEEEPDDFLVSGPVQLGKCPFADDDGDEDD